MGSKAVDKLEHEKAQHSLIDQFMKGNFRPIKNRETFLGGNGVRTKIGRERGRCFLDA